MKEISVQIDEQMQISKSKDGNYLAFAFLERGNDLDFEVAGWVHFEPEKSRINGASGIVRLWGHEIPIIERNGITNLSETTCIIIFEYSIPQKHYLAILVDEIAKVFNIGEKDASISSIVETEIVDDSGGVQIQYSFVSQNLLFTP